VGRYDRHTGLPGFGSGSQEKLLCSSALVVGAGGIGSPILYYLTAAGVGRLGILDYDTVEISNLNRQILHFTSDLGSYKADSANTKLRELNPDVKVEKHILRMDDSNASEIFEGYDIVLGAVDNQEARRVINRACHKAGKPYIDGSVAGYTGMIYTFSPLGGPCRACMFPGEKPHKTIPPAVLGATAGTVGSIMAAEAVKYLASQGSFQAGRIIYIDISSGIYETITLQKLPGCDVCGR
jgi:molybdopterin/thiamine biosynthesis adenylyltransferase